MFLKLLESWHLTVDSHHNLISCGSKPSLMSFSQTLVGHVTGKSPKNTAENHVSGCFRQIVQTKPLTVLFSRAKRTHFLGGLFWRISQEISTQDMNSFAQWLWQKTTPFLVTPTKYPGWFMYLSIYRSIYLSESIYLNLSIWIYMYVCR